MRIFIFFTLLLSFPIITPQNAFSQGWGSKIIRTTLPYYLLYRLGYDIKTKNIKKERRVKRVMMSKFYSNESSSLINRKLNTRCLNENSLDELPQIAGENFVDFCRSTSRQINGHDRIENNISHSLIYVDDSPDVIAFNYHQSIGVGEEVINTYSEALDLYEEDENESKLLMDSIKFIGVGEEVINAYSEALDLYEEDENESKLLMNSIKFIMAYKMVHQKFDDCSSFNLNRLMPLGYSVAINLPVSPLLKVGCAIGFKMALYASQNLKMAKIERRADLEVKKILGEEVSKAGAHYLRCIRKQEKERILKDNCESDAIYCNYFRKKVSAKRYLKEFGNTDLLKILDFSDELIYQMYTGHHRHKTREKYLRVEFGSKTNSLILKNF